MLIPLPGSNTPAEVWPVSAYTLRRRLARSPWLEIGLALAVSALLLAYIGADPTRGITGSESPFTDEAWNVMNARNFVLLGTWSTDQFNLHLVYGPFSLLEAGIFSVLGVGVVQARLLSILAIGLTTLALSVGLRRPLGRRPALLAAAAFGTCFLVLYYGRLAYTETLVMLAMTAGALLLVRAGESRGNGRLGLFAGLMFGVAIATKANAGFGVAGILVGIGILEARSSSTRRAIGGALFGLALVSAIWLGVVFVPMRDAVLLDLRIWHHQSLPRSVGQLLLRIVSYPFRSDGALPGLLPLAMGAGLGTVATVIGWRSLSPPTRRLAVAAIGWLTVELAVLFLVSYRPNRYVLPLLPAAAILVGVAAHVLLTRDWTLARSRPGLATVVAGIAVAALTLPGLVAFGRWMSRATDTLEPMQARVAGILPRGAVVWGGFGPLVAMTAPVTTIVPWPDVPANVGPAFLRMPAHWVVTGNHVPSWIVPGSPVWAARVERACFKWTGAEVCLDEVP